MRIDGGGAVVNEFDILAKGKAVSPVQKIETALYVYVRTRSGTLGYD
jgi:hypothetical protein